MKKSKRSRIFIFAVVLLVCAFGAVFMLNLFTKAPTNLGVVDGQLAECPSSPNCVCTQTKSASHQMEPISFESDAAAAMSKLVAVVDSMPRTKIVEQTEDYLRIEFTTAIMRYVDDVEFLIDSEAKLVHFRSASRIGHSDLGANRKRMEAVKAAFGE